MATYQNVDGKRELVRKTTPASEAPAKQERQRKDPEEKTPKKLNTEEGSNVAS